ncbi:unnamed protein product [Meloidogyne enterolobii]|uniref:Uncharacterized protein n=1 Tax=Meloidogyne enterolobii TaxID=390850 RepID=A0ACB0YTP6_MELEN
MLFGVDIIFDFLLEYIPNCLLSLIFTIISFCIWESTSLSSDYLQFNYWVVQLRRRRSAVIIPITDLDTLNTTDSTASSTPNTPASLASEESSDQSSDVINRFFIVQAPSSTRNISPQLLSAILNHNSFSSMNSQFSGEQEEQTSSASDAVNNSQNEENNGDRDINTLTNLSVDSICIRIKFLDDSLKIVQTNKNVTIGNFKRLHFSEELKEGKIIRLIYQGRLLRDDSSTLEYYGLTDQCVLHCHVGTRPYSTNNAGGGGNENNNRAGENGAQNGGGGATSPGILGTGPRMVETGFWLILFNFVFSYAWNLVRIVWEWANRQEEEEEAAPTGTLLTFLFYFRQRIRRFLSVFLDILVGPAFVAPRQGGGANQQQQQNNRNLDDTRYNIGNLMALIVFVKFLLLWSFVLVYPQFTDRRSIFFLSMLTSTCGLYFYFSRSNALQRQQRRTSN